MAPQVGLVDGHGHDVACPGRYLLVAAGAEVGLPGLVGLDSTHLQALFLSAPVVGVHEPIIAVTGAR